MPTWYDRLTGFKRWGLTSAVENPSDADANTGFAYLGTTKPSAQLHDALFQYKDDIDIYLYRLMLNLFTSAGITPAYNDYTTLGASISKLFDPGRMLNIQVFTSSGTYTPTVGMAFAIIKCQGGGGAGGGGTGATGTNVSLGAPGTDGSYGEGKFFAASIGASKTVTIGAGGAATSGGTGGNGGASSVGTLITAPGGIGGNVLVDQAAPTVNGNGTFSAAPSGANLYSRRGAASTVSTALSQFNAAAAPGGSSIFGNGGYGIAINGTGIDAVNYGSGGGAAVVNQGGGTIFGGNGFKGIVIIEEYR